MPIVPGCDIGAGRVSARAAGQGTLRGVTTLNIAHVSDTHIGLEAYKALSASGENQRSVDMARAFVSACDAIVDADPDLVIHSGDVADRVRIPVRLMLLIRQQLTKLAGLRADGSRRQVVVVAGNHELPRDRREACFLELYRGIPGVHIVTRDYTVVDFPDDGTSASRPESLSEVLVHCLPHDALKEVDFDSVVPVEGKLNILTAHGVAGGSELYVRSLGREFALPTDVLVRNWDYGALGHWHKQGPIPLLSAGGGSRKRRKTTDSDGFIPGEDYLPVDEGAARGRIWYAGSTENCGFGDMKENGVARGWLMVQVQKGAEPVVERRNVPTRTMLRLPVLDASGMSPDDISASLVERLSEVPVSGSILSQVVQGVTRETWSLVDTSAARAKAGTALHYEVSVRYDSTTPAQGQATGGLAGVEALLDDAARTVLSEPEREGGLRIAKNLLREEMERRGEVPESSPDTAASVTGGEAA